jgi:hypothetical protein
MPRSGDAASSQNSIELGSLSYGGDKWISLSGCALPTSH